MLPLKTTSTVTVGTSPVTLYTITPSKNGGVEIFYSADNVGLSTRSDMLMVSWDVSANTVKVSDLSTPDNVEAIAAPTPGCTLAKAASGDQCTDGVHRVKATFVTAYGETEMGTIDTGAVTVTGNDNVTVTGIPASSNVAVTARNLYMTEQGGSNYYLAATVAGRTTTTGTIAISDANLLLAAAGPTVNTATQPNTNALSFGASMSGGVVSLTATSTSGSWTVDTVEIARIA
jgi:hypothetical protein